MNIESVTKSKDATFVLPKTNFQTWSNKKIDAKIFSEKSLIVPKNPNVDP